MRPKHRLAHRWFLVRAVPHRDAAGRVTKWFGTTTGIDAQQLYAKRQETIATGLTEMIAPADLPVIPNLNLSIDTLGSGGAMASDDIAVLTLRFDVAGEAIDRSQPVPAAIKFVPATGVSDVAIRGRGPRDETVGAQATGLSGSLCAT